MNFYVTVFARNARQFYDVKTSAPDPETAKAQAVAFVDKLLNDPEERGFVVAESVKCMPPNAYLYVVQPDGTHELAVGYLPIDTVSCDPDIMTDIEPLSVLTLHMDESGEEAFAKRGGSATLAGAQHPASTPIFTLSERVIARVVKSFKPNPKP